MQIDPDGVRQRWRQFQDPELVLELQERCSAGVAVTKWLPPGAHDWELTPYATLAAGDEPIAERNEPIEPGTRVGRDDQGRVLEVIHADRTTTLFFWRDDEDVVEQVDLTDPLRLTVFLYGRSGGEWMTCDGTPRHDGLPAVALGTSLMHHDVSNERTLFVLDIRESAREAAWDAWAFAYVLTHAGEVARVERVALGTGLAPGGDRDAAQHDAIVAAGRAELPSEPAPTVWVTDRRDLVRALKNEGLAANAVKKVVDDARWAIVLDVSRDRAAGGESRVGGRPILAADTAWPEVDGRPLTHLATVALDDVGAVEGRELLPPDGYLSVFSEMQDVYDEETEDGEPFWGAVAIIHTPGGVPTHVPSYPDCGTSDAFTELPHLNATPAARLQIRSASETLSKLIGDDDDRACELAELINGDHLAQLFGYPPTIHGSDVMRDDQQSLFFIADDSSLGFGSIPTQYFYGDPDDIRDARWERLTAEPGLD
jgi:Domain of unknown function (DUF1963)